MLEGISRKLAFVADERSLASGPSTRRLPLFTSQELQAHGYTQDVFLSQAHTPATAQAGEEDDLLSFQSLQP